jgi:tetratricopeptide (TPR) repeat protein
VNEPVQNTIRLVSTPSAPALTRLPDLMHPGAFAQWWLESTQRRRVQEPQLADRLERLGTEIAFVRASLVLGYAPAVLERTRRLAGLALGANDPVIRLFALCQIAFLETKSGFHARRGEFCGAPVVVDLFGQLLAEVQDTYPKSLLLAEVEARLHRGLSEAHLLGGEYDEARHHIVRAIGLGQGLEMKLFVAYSRLFLGSIALNAGRHGEARPLYEAILDDPETPEEVSIDAQVYLAMCLYWLGDDDAALALLDELTVHQPRNPHALFYRECLLALTGRGGMDAAPDVYRQFLPNGPATLFECHQLLFRANEQRSRRERDPRRHLIELRRVIEALRPTSPYVKATSAFLRSLASLRLDEVGLAMQHYVAPRATDDHPVSVRVLTLGLAIEIALHPHGRDLIPLERATRAVAQLLEDQPPSVRTGLARRFLLMLPVAGAFLAYSPHSLPEFVIVCGPSVMNCRTHPIAVYGRQGLRPTQAIRLTLERFGQDVTDMRAGGGQSDAEERTLLQVSGERLHWFTPVPPAQLVYHFIRIHESLAQKTGQAADSLWYQSALDVASRYGLLPHDARGPYAKQGKTIRKALGLLIDCELTCAGFRSFIGW